MTNDDREEHLAEIRGEELLMELAARAELARTDSPYFTDERLIAWLDEEANSPDRRGDEWSRSKITAAAARLRAKAAAMRLQVRRREGRPPVSNPAAGGTIPQVLADANAVHAAPLLDLSAAAGVGRDLWDEPCDSWVEIPDDVPSGQYIAIEVKGESMIPLMHTGDTILVRLGATLARDTVVLARVPDGGYVVKQVGRITGARVELLSLNREFPAVEIPRDERTIVGTVMLRWCPHGEAA